MKVWEIIAIVLAWVAVLFLLSVIVGGAAGCHSPEKPCEPQPIYELEPIEYLPIE